MSNAACLRVLLVFGLASSAQAETPPAACGGSEPFRFALQASNTDGASWSGGTVQVNARPSQTIYVRFRTLMTVTSGQTQGWSFGVQHTNAWTQYYGGSVSISSVTTTNTQTATVQSGSPPDTNHLQLRPTFKGYTQGVSIDNDQVITLAPTTNFVTSKGCLAITPPSNSGTYTIDLKFSHDIANPRIRATISQDGQSKTTCAYNVQLSVYVNPYVTPTVGTCGTSGAAMVGGGEQGKEESPAEEAKEGGGVALLGAEAGCPASCTQFSLKDFKRGDANSSGTADVSDAIFVLNYLFTFGTAPTCLNAADSNDDEQIDIADPIFLLFFLFAGGEQPPDPFSLCGPDTSALTNSSICALRGLDCQSYAACVQTDSDSDGLTNFYEDRIDTNENATDHDGDGVADGQEVLVFRTNPKSIDTDCDHFTDGQELGFSSVPGCNGGSFNLCNSDPAKTADPLKKDIFIEVDFMREVGGDNHRPIYTTLEFVENRFKPKGFNLHFDIGPRFPPTADPKWEKYNYGNTANELPETNEITLAFMKSNIKPQHFDNNNRCNVFHYCVFGHASSHNGPSGDVVGESEQFGDDMTITLNTGTQASFAERLNLMHELGHNLGLQHGGFEQGSFGNPNDPKNFKPNYRSIMGFLYSQSGIDVNGNGILDDFGPHEERINFSSVAVTLDENNLNENTGITGVGPAVDFNCNGNTNEVGLQRNVQCADWGKNGPNEVGTPECNCQNSPGLRSFIVGFDDWSNIVLFKNKDVVVGADCGGGGGGGGSEEEAVACYRQVP